MTNEQWLDCWRRYEIIAPGASAWLQANSPSPKATVVAWGERFAGIPAETLREVLRRINAGRLEVPHPANANAWLLNYCQRILQDEQRERERKQPKGRHWRDDRGRDEWHTAHYAAVWHHYKTLAFSGGTPGSPCLEPNAVAIDHERQGQKTREWFIWCRYAIREAGLYPGDRTADEYREAVLAAGIDLREGLPMFEFKRP